MWALFTYSCFDFCGDHLASSLELLFIEQMVAALHQLTPAHKPIDVRLHPRLADAPVRLHRSGFLQCGLELRALGLPVEALHLLLPLLLGQPMRDTLSTPTERIMEQQQDEGA
jgi:hypothetical protein